MTTSEANYPSIAVGNDRALHVVWVDDGAAHSPVLYSSSLDNGLNWSPEIKINDTVPQIGGPPTILVGSLNSIMVSWPDPRDLFTRGSVYVCFDKSMDNGSSWADDIRVDTFADPKFLWSVDLSINSNGKLYAIWADNRNGNFDIFGTWSTDGGANWGEEYRIDKALRGSAIEAVGQIDGGGNPWVVWRDNRNDPDPEDSADDYDLFLSQAGDPLLHVTKVPGTVNALLQWTDVGTTYMVHRSPYPDFPPDPETVSFIPDGGPSGTGYLDRDPLVPGKIFYYLVTSP